LGKESGELGIGKNSWAGIGIKGGMGGRREEE